MDWFVVGVGCFRNLSHALTPLPPSMWLGSRAQTYHPMRFDTIYLTMTSVCPRKCMATLWFQGPWISKKPTTDDRPVAQRKRYDSHLRRLSLSRREQAHGLLLSMC